MPEYLFTYLIDGETHISRYYSKIKLSRNKQLKAAKKQFFKEHKIKVGSHVVKESWEDETINQSKN